MRRQVRRVQLAATAAAVALTVAGCGTSAEPTAKTFYTEHAGEAARVAGAVAAVTADVSSLAAEPSRAQVEALAVKAHIAGRRLLAALQWTVAENGEEEGVSQAEREVNEAAGALAKSMTAVRRYADTGRQAALADYRYELRGGRERWDQGISQLWFLSHERNPPRF